MSLSIILIAAVIVIILLIVMTGYRKAPPDKVYIISGRGDKKKYLIGKAGIKLPIIERIDTLSLRMITIDVRTSEPIPSGDFIDLNVDSVAVVKIPNDPKYIEKAAQNFLNRDEDYISEKIVNVLEGNLRESIGALPLRAIMSDRKAFGEKVSESATQDLEKLGMEVLSFNIQSISDNGKGIIDNLGAANTAAIRKDALISKAEADKEVAVKQAEANNAANDAKVKSDTEIAQRENQLAIKKAELKAQADVEIQKASAAGEIEAKIQDKAIKTEAVNAEIAKAEREAELKQKEVDVKEQELAASIKKQAEADRYAAEQQAQAELVARQKQAEADRYEAEQKAAGIKAQYNAEAEGIRAKGQAEAEAARAKGLAEAEAMEKKAEAYKKYNGAAIVEMLVKIMPDMAKSVAEPVGNIKDMRVYGENGADAVGRMTPSLMKQTFDMMSDATGVDFKEILRSNTYDAKVNKNITLDTKPVQVEMKEKPEKQKKQEKIETQEEKSNNILSDELEDENN